MKKRIKDIVIGFIIGCLLMTTTPVLADSILQKIDVLMNVVNVEINGERLESNSILYNGSTYLPLRKVAEAVGKEVEWTQNTMTANIVDNIEEGDVTDNIVYTENGIIFNEKEYYDNGYVFDIIQDYKDYLWVGYGIGENIKITLIKTLEDGNEEILIDYVPYFLYNERVYISSDYLAETILPLLNSN